MVNEGIKLCKTFILFVLFLVKLKRSDILKNKLFNKHVKRKVKIFQVKFSYFINLLIDGRLEEV